VIAIYRHSCILDTWSSFLGVGAMTDRVMCLAILLGLQQFACFPVSSADDIQVQRSDTGEVSSVTLNGFTVARVCLIGDPPSDCGPVLQHFTPEQINAMQVKAGLK
jgi:hypothetical protein